MKIKKILFKVVRRKEMGSVIALVFKYFPSIIPTKKFYVDESVIACFHPVPSYDYHAIIVPRTRMRSIVDCRNFDFCRSVIYAAELISNKREENQNGYLLCVNGGIRQDVQQVHFHLISQDNLNIGDHMESGVPYDDSGCLIYFDQNSCIITLTANKGSHIDNTKRLFECALNLLRKTVDKNILNEAGFSLKMKKLPDRNEFEEKIYIAFENISPDIIQEKIKKLY